MHRSIPPALAVLIAGAPLAGGAAEADPAPGPEGVGCEIRAGGTAGRVKLAGLAVAATGVSGRYAFTLHKEGRGGSSDVVQGGDFRIAPGRPSVLNQVELVLAPGEAWHATMTLDWPGGSLACRKDGSGPQTAP